MLTLFKAHKEGYVFILRRDTESFFSSSLGTVYKSIGGFTINDPSRGDDSDEVYSCPLVCVLDRE